MSRKIKSTRRPQAPKARNFEAKAVRDPNGAFRPKVIKDLRKKKPKYPFQVDLSDE